MRRKKGYFSISAVAQMFSVHQQTIRLYEKEGLINPKRSEGNTRIFSEEDVDRLEEIIYLTHEVGINLAGVDMILKLQKKIKALQDQINKAFNESQKEMLAETEEFKQTIQRHIKQLSTAKETAHAKKIRKKTEEQPLLQGKTEQQFIHNSPKQTKEEL